MNSKILLVYEEYSELMTAQTALQKVGFDVLAISSEYTLSENIVSFNPEVVVAFGRGGKVSSLSAGRRLREMTRWGGKVLLVMPSGYKPNPQDFAKIRADMLLEAPVPPVRLVQVLAKMLGHDEAALIEKLNKQSTEPAKGDGGGPLLNGPGGAAANNDFTYVGGRSPENPEDVKVRSKKSDPDLEELWNELTTGKGPEKSTPSFGLNNPAEDPTSPQAVNAKMMEAGIAPFETGKAPPQPAKPTKFDLKEREQELSEHELEQIMADLEKAKKSARDRVAKYAQYVEPLEKDFDSSKGLQKIAARKTQKDQAKAWNQEEIQNQDNLRREFTKALYRKK